MARHVTNLAATGAAQTVTVPTSYAGGFQFDLAGAGANTAGINSLGGFGGPGGRVTGTYAVAVGDILMAYVGRTNTGQAGGWGYALGGNGGAAAPNSIRPGGGGAGSTALLDSSTLVAGGGGGGGVGGNVSAATAFGDGGYGGGSTAVPVGPTGGTAGGTTGAAGAGGGGGPAGAVGASSTGTAGVAGSGDAAVGGYGGGGGGGGGGFGGGSGGGGGRGGGSGPTTALANGGGGGGGTSTLGAASNAYFFDNYRAGDGYVTLSWLAAPIARFTGIESSPSTSGYTVVDTSAPPLHGSYQSLDGAAMQAYRLWVYALPAGGMPVGFDWRTGHYPGDGGVPLPSLSDTGTVYANLGATFTLTPATLPNGNMIAYLGTEDAAGADAVWAYTSMTWTQAVVGPTAPTVTVTPVQASARVVLALTSTAGSGTNRFHVQRSTDAVVWTDAVNGSAIPTFPGLTIGFHDRGAPREVNLWYRAQGVSVSNGNVLNGVWSAPIQTYLLSDGRDWIFSVADPSLDRPITYQGPNLARSSHEDSVAYAPEGRADYVVFHGTIHDEAFVSGVGSQLFTFAFGADADYTNFKAIRATQQPFCLKTTYGDAAGNEQWWLSFGPDAGITSIGGGGHQFSGIGREPQIRTVQIAAYAQNEPANQPAKPIAAIMPAGSQWGSGQWATAQWAPTAFG